jgi:hypothetical protein
MKHAVLNGGMQQKATQSRGTEATQPSSPYPLLEYLVAIVVELREIAIGCCRPSSWSDECEQGL